MAQGTISNSTCSSKTTGVLGVSMGIIRYVQASLAMKQAIRPLTRMTVPNCIDEELQVRAQLTIRERSDYRPNSKIGLETTEH
jgi:hypothetical protein